MASRTAGTGLEQCLVAQNAASRPDLSPWLASLHVEPRFRGIGIAPVLVTVVEAAACRSDFGRRWLFADGQVPLRASLAWVEHGVLHDHGRPCVLMRRDRRAG